METYKRILTKNSENHCDIDDIHLVWFNSEYNAIKEPDSLEVLFREQKISEQIFHTHSMIELFCSGNVTMNIFFRDEMVTLEKNEVLAIAPNVYHHTDITDDKRNKEIQVLSFTFRTNSLSVQRPLYKLLKTYLIDRPYFKTSDNNKIFDTLIRMRSYESDEKNTLTASCMYEVILKIVQKLHGLETISDYQRFLIDSTASRIVKIESVFSQLFMYPITIKQLASVLHISTRQLNRIILKQYGITYHAKLASIRVEAARGLLARTELQVNEIANMTGFTSEKQFYITFKKHIGFTPNNYRKIIRQT